MPRSRTVTSLSKCWDVRFVLWKTHPSLVVRISGVTTLRASTKTEAITKVKRRLKEEFPQWDNEEFKCSEMNTTGGKDETTTTDYR